MLLTRRAGALSALACLSLAACGREASLAERRTHSSSDATEGDAQGVAPRLGTSPTDQVLTTLVIPFGADGLTLTDPNGDAVHWVVDMEAAEKVEAGVAADKYLRIKGDLEVPNAAENRLYDVGCLFVELKDNVYYRENTWLRLATRSGIKGKKYQEVTLPLSVDLGGWQSVPSLSDSIKLKDFSGNTIKKFDGTVCFRLDFADAPAQEYEGELIVQYLRPGDEANPPRCDVMPDNPACAPSSGGGATDGASDGDDEPTPTELFACSTEPAVLKAGQEIELAWKGAPANIEVKLSADPASYSGALGSITALSPGHVRYKAPDKVGGKVRVIATGRALGAEALPAFCEVNLVPDEDICIPDDGEIKGLTANVYALPENTQKLPNFDNLTPIARVITPNVDIPERRFSVGFPGVRDRFEWFGIRLRGQLLIPEDQVCSFRLTADDGAILYIDGNQVIDNDGLHYTKSKVGDATLAKGSHAFKIDYFQGPRYYITLQLLWKCGNAADYSIVPPSAFARPLQ